MEIFNQKKLNKPKVLKLIIILVLIILITVFIILYNRNSSVRFFLDKYVFQKYVTSDALQYITLDASNNNNYYIYNNKLAVLSQNALRIYNKSCTELCSLDVQINSPLFASAGDFLCIAEKHGDKFYVITDKNISWQKSIEGNINNISINKNGYVAVSLQNGSYQSIIIAFNQNGNELFKYYLSKDYVVATAFSNDNKYLAIGHANFSGAIIESKIKIISVQNASLSSENSLTSEYSAPANDLITNIKYSNDGTLMCMFNSYIGTLDDNSIKTFYNFENEKIIYASLNNSFVTIVKNSNGLITSSFDVKITNPINSNSKVYNITEEPKALYVSPSVIALNFGTTAVFINNNASLLKEYSSSQEIKNILLSDSLACIVYKDKIEFLPL